MRGIFRSLLLMILMAVTAGVSYPKVEDDIYYHGFYYGKDGAVVFRIPELSTSQWTQIGPVKSGDVHIIQLYLGSPKSYQGMISILVYPPQKKKIDTKNELIGLYKIITKSSPNMKAVSDSSTLETDGGNGHQVLLKGKNAKGVEENAAIAVIADGPGAFALMVRGIPSAMEKQLLPVVKQIVDSVRLGDTVKKPPKGNPGKAIEGVFQGPYHINYDGSGTQYWMIFDKNGYYLDFSPKNPLYTDLNAYFVYNNYKLPTYKVSGNKIILKWVNGDTYTYDFSYDGKVMTLGGDDYTLLSGKGDGMKLNGKYEAFNYYSSSYGLGDQFSFMSSSVYWFDKNGNFESSSYVGSHYSESSVKGNLIDWVDASAEKKSKKGKYTIKNNLLLLKYDNGASAALSFYPYVNIKGNVESGLIYISGVNYLSED